MDGLRQLRPDLGRYYLAVSLLGFAVDGGVYAVLLNLFLARLGYGPEVIGLVNAAGMVVFALASLPAGIVGGAGAASRSCSGAWDCSWRARCCCHWPICCRPWRACPG
ncbi:MAG TPA: hypothetical protein VLA19_12650 [Herpetosiphonaceae bacterium]|nr:hypothetical protein [Herpetosiphonaceae bacterium]